MLIISWQALTWQVAHLQTLEGRDSMLFTGLSAANAAFAFTLCLLAGSFSHITGSQWISGTTQPEQSEEPDMEQQRQQAVEPRTERTTSREAHVKHTTPSQLGGYLVSWIQKVVPLVCGFVAVFVLWLGSEEHVASSTDLWKISLGALSDDLEHHAKRLMNALAMTVLLTTTLHNVVREFTELINCAPKRLAKRSKDLESSLKLAQRQTSKLKARSMFSCISVHRSNTKSLDEADVAANHVRFKSVQQSDTHVNNETKPLACAECVRQNCKLVKGSLFSYIDLWNILD
eukprot:COSAG05_NODE_5322_length_1207_cov_1.872744_1_plen_287_part_10